MFVTRKIWAITVPCIVLFCFSNPVRGEADSVSWQNLSEHLAQESIPIIELNVSTCPNNIEGLEPSRVVAQIIENTFYLWEEYDILTDKGVETICIVMKKPNPASLSKEESQVLLTASSLWRESKPRPKDAIILDASDPSLNLPPIESFLGDEGQSFEPENVIGTDDRTRITDTTSYPWRTHCYLELYFPLYSARGTGCLVSPYMVLTCAHNVYNQDYSDFVTNVTIAPGQKQSYEGGSVTRPYGTREGVDFQTNSSYISGGSWEHDYGAVFFSSPFSGINTFMPLEWSGPSVGETVYLAGYPREVKLGTPDAEANSQGLWRDSDPVHTYTTSKILCYTIDTSEGQSGAPVLKKDYVMDPGRIIAIHAYGNSTANGGPRLRLDNQSLITQWMQWEPPRPCEDCEPEDAYLGTIGTVVWDYNVIGNCGNGGKWVGQFVGESGAIYHFDLCPSNPGSGTANFDADIKITNSACTIIPGAGQNGYCISSSYDLPNDFQWTCTANGAYYVIIAPYNSSTSHTCGGDSSDTFALKYYKEGPPNDMFANATPISGTSGQVTGRNVGATKESGEPDHCGSGGASVWWRWTAPANSCATIDTNGSSFNTLLAVYEGSSLLSLVSKRCDDNGGEGNQSRVVFDAVAGTIYRIAVDGYSGATGDIILNWDLPDCFPSSFTTYADWVAYGKPCCWCNSLVLGEDISDTGPANYTAGDYQCDGDANTDQENPGLKWRVSASDLSLLIANWKKPIATANPCADIKHDYENPGLKWRVSAGDLARLISNWKKNSSQLPGNCGSTGRPE